MTTIIQNISAPEEVQSTVYLFKETEELNDFSLNEAEKEYLKKRVEGKAQLIALNRLTHWLYFVQIQEKPEAFQVLETLRKKAAELTSLLNKEKISSILVSGKDQSQILAFSEGIALSNYQFLKHKTKTEEKENSLKEVLVLQDEVSEEAVNELNILIDSVTITRNLVNEPHSSQTAHDLADEIIHLGHECGFEVEVLNEQKIEALKMGGLLGVNRGSKEPPTFSIMEWKPENATNEKPVVFVGKGVVFDTGGVNLKVHPGSIDTMKCDMGGAATVIGLLSAVAKAKLPLHVIGLVPATDNRPGYHAYVPGDVLTMHNGTTVEVLNTDAEGRLILADALSYADKYSPELIINLATLTGSAAMATGKFASVIMGNADDKVFNQLEESGNEVYERLVRFPFWEEFDELLKSEIADLKNLGGREAGAITAGKFLEHFTKHPLIHMDIAGTAYVETADSYRGLGATGVGVRLLYNYLKKIK